MIEETLNFKLQDKLIDHIMIFNHLFWHLFNGKNGSSRPMESSEDCTEFSLP